MRAWRALHIRVIGRPLLSARSAALGAPLWAGHSSPRPALPASGMVCTALKVVPSHASYHPPVMHGYHPRVPFTPSVPIDLLSCRIFFFFIFYSRSSCAYSVRPFVCPFSPSPPSLRAFPLNLRPCASTMFLISRKSSLSLIFTLVVQGPRNTCPRPFCLRSCILALT